MLIDTHKDARHTKVLLDFIAYCNTHPTERFWQALLNWSGQNFILFSKFPARDYHVTFSTFELIDPYSFEGRDN